MDALAPMRLRADNRWRMETIWVVLDEEERFWSAHTSRELAEAFVERMRNGDIWQRRACLHVREEPLDED